MPDAVWEVVRWLVSGGAFTAMIAAIVKTVRRWRKSVKQRYLKEGLDDQETIWILLEELRQRIGAVRSIVFVTENCGGVPLPDKDLYSTILYESVDNGFKRLKRKWQKLKVDKHYKGIIWKLYEEGRWQATVNKLPPSILRDRCSLEGVAYLEKFRIQITPHCFFYLALHFVATPQIDSKRRFLITSTLSSIGRILEKYGDTLMKHWEDTDAESSSS